MRERAGMTIEEVATRAGVDPQWLASIEAGVGTHDVLYSQWLTLVRATQPPRPEWWDDGHEHDLHLPPGGHHEPRTPAEQDYWERIERVRSGIREHYRRGRPLADRP
jgi:transcriptional regulator with XRE-family HTH domain